MQKNLALRLCFDGSAFCGWQIQPNGPTVQAEVEQALLRATGQVVHVTGCSRTDAGVHARVFCCHVKFGQACNIPPAQLPAALNFYLPEQISVLACREVSNDFHARYDCRAKTYRYHIHNARQRDPFLLRRALLESYPLDEEMLAQQAAAFVGTHDFASFCAAGGSAKTTVRTVTRFDVVREDEDVFFFVRGDGFLYHMVRIMAGTLLDIAKGRLPQGSIPGILAARDRSKAGFTAPAEGLMLWDAEYEEQSI